MFRPSLADVSNVDQLSFFSKTLNPDDNTRQCQPSLARLTMLTTPRRLLLRSALKRCSRFLATSSPDDYARASRASKRPLAAREAKRFATDELDDWETGDSLRERSRHGGGTPRGRGGGRGRGRAAGMRLGGGGRTRGRYSGEMAWWEDDNELGQGRRGREPPPRESWPPAASVSEKEALRDFKPRVLVRQRQDSSPGIFFGADTFESVGADEEMISAVGQFGFSKPSHVQALAYKPLLEARGQRAVLLADQAGSGKTLAYLLPLMQRLRQEEGAPDPGRPPRMLVVTPTEELCAQVLRIVRALAKVSPLRSVALTGGGKFRTQREFLEEGVDLVVATPGRLWQLYEAGHFQFKALEALVLDECDVLLGDGFDFAEFVEPLRDALPPQTPTVLVTATIPGETYAQLEQIFGEVKPLLGPNLHRLAGGVEERIVDCSGGEINEEAGFIRKFEAMYSLMNKEAAQRTIIFCNKIETCRKVENFMHRRDRRGQKYEVLPYHTAIEEKSRATNLKRFLKSPKPTDESEQHQERHQRPMVLISTDRASRGIDGALVDHVVLFDFPRDPSEYVRRVGRTARGAGGTGAVSVLVLGRQVPLAQKILNRSEKGLPVERLPIP
mmetsp:Transcript_11822/g.38856  ORF Transcript_11822/g.38856 Transcript_11822/m.38856 type:complete len:614 (-) Transcript_11822:1787-3628(-)